MERDFLPSPSNCFCYVRWQHRCGQCWCCRIICSPWHCIIIIIIIIIIINSRGVGGGSG
jgi:hypothetical protein